MAEDKIRLEQVQNDEQGERFLIIFIDGQKAAARPGYVMTTDGPKTDAEVRAFLEQRNTPTGQIEEMFRLARTGFRRNRFRIDPLPPISN